MPLQDKNINRDFLETVKNLNSALIDVEEIYERQSETIDLDELYSLHQKIEKSLYSLGKIVCRKEYEEKRSAATVSEEIGDTNTDDLSKAEQTAIRQYRSRYCSDSVSQRYSLEQFQDKGYKLTLPYLLNRKAKLGLHYLAKRKYIVGVFQDLVKLYSCSFPINKLDNATVIFVTHSPIGRFDIRDNDNADARDIINLVKEIFLSQDDSGSYVNIFFDSAESDEYFTEVYIVPKISAYDIVLHPENQSKISSVV